MVFLMIGLINRFFLGKTFRQQLESRLRRPIFLCFLLSQDFIASEACREEWHLAGEVPSVTRVPVILSECSWKDMQGMSELKALPKDGKPIKNFGNRDTAWNQIYDGLKLLIGELRRTFTIKAEFREEMERTEFISQEHVSLQSTFVFPRLSSYSATSNEESIERTIKDKRQLLGIKYALVHGEELSGKTALCRHLFLSLVDDAKPVIYMDLNT